VEQFEDLKRVLHQDLVEIISVALKVKVQHLKLKTVLITQLQSARKLLKRKMESAPELHPLVPARHLVQVHHLADVARSQRARLFLVVTQFLRHFAKMFLRQSSLLRAVSM
jgi:hypothetical protein